MNKKITEIYNAMIQRTKFTDEISREMEKELKELLKKRKARWNRWNMSNTGTSCFK